jgi:hypothetical protein
MCKDLEQTKLLARHRYTAHAAPAAGARDEYRGLWLLQGHNFTKSITEYLHITAQLTVYLDSKVEMVCNCCHHGNKERGNSPMWMAKETVIDDPRQGNV